MTLYFAYGANMDPVHMADRCPGAERIGAAELRGHEFGIAAGGFGTVRSVPVVEGSPSGSRVGAATTVYGVLWKLTSADLAALDLFEGVAENFYARRSAPVHTPDGRVHDAMIYRPGDDSPGTASPGYLERIVEVAALLGFPPGYIDRLREFLPSRNQPGANRR